MFKNDKYITRGINASISVLTQIMIWDMIETARSKTELDYLQVFKLSPETKDGLLMQKIIHTQEQPEYKNCIYIVCDDPITPTIFCIDDEDHSTMLLAKEY